MATAIHFVAIIPNNKTIYRDGNGITLRFLEERNITDIFFTTDEDKLVEHLIIDSTSINPMTDEAARNISNLIAVFGKGWIRKFINGYFVEEYRQTVSNLINWIAVFKSVRILVGPRGELVNLNEEITQLEQLQTVADVEYQNNLDKNNTYKINEQKELIEKIVSGRGKQIISAINTKSNMMAQIALDLGKKYNAKDMMISEKNENNIILFKVHEALFNVLKEYGLGNVDINDIENKVSDKNVTKILESDKLTPPNYSKIIKELSDDQIIAAIFLGRIPLDAASNKIQRSIDKKKVPQQDEKNIYTRILEYLIPIFTDCPLEEVYKGRLKYSDLSCSVDTSTIEHTKTKNYDFNSILPFFTDINANVYIVDTNENNVPAKVVELMHLLYNATKNTIKKSELGKIVKSITSFFLSKKNYINFKGLEENQSKSSNKVVDRLEPWQAQLVDVIIEKNSCLVVSPTSGGKTFASMVAFDQLFQMYSENVELIYVAPNFYQALQVYFNLIKTFPSRIDNIGLLTKSINITPNKCKVWIGTPVELWLYAESSNLKFQRGIFDEIHTISTSYGDTLEDETQSIALMKLISLVTEQFVGLSATIHAEDLISLKMKIEELTKLKLKDSIVYDKRPVRLDNYIWTGSDIKEIQSNNNISNNNDNIIIPVTPESTFSLLKKIQTDKLGPTLFFDMKEADSYDYFTQFIEYLENRFKNEYSNWIKVNDKWKNAIDDFNNNNNTSEKARSNLLSKIIESLKLAISDSLENKTKTTPTRRSAVISRRQAKTNIGEITLTPQMSKLLSSSLEEGTEIPEKVTPETYDLLLQLQKVNRDIQTTTLTNIEPVCDTVGTYFRFSKSPYNSIFHQLTHPSTAISQEYYNFMLQLTEAEGARSDDVKNIYNLIDRSLHFGIGILLPNMPFSVQYQVLKMLDKRELDVVFVSKSMSMGVNFPARTCILRNSENVEINVSQGLQMKGRAGRRGLIKDDFALAIMWNIKNADKLNNDNLPKITYPIITPRDENSGTVGILIQNAESDGLRIAKIMITDDNILRLKLASEILSQINKRLERLPQLPLGEERLPLNNNIFLDEDEDNTQTNRNENNTRSNRNNNIQLSRNENMTSNLSLVSSIKVAVEVVCDNIIIKETDEQRSTRINNIITHIKEVSEGNNDITLKKDAYHWAEEINVIKYGLQELHTLLHKRKSVELLNYIVTLYELIHRVSMRYLGFAYEKGNK